jgi:predicted RNase H-like HicB family nuclease
MRYDRARSRGAGPTARYAAGNRTRSRTLSREGLVEAVKSYRVVYVLDESGHWLARVPRVKGCHTYGRSLSEARSRIREALGLFVTNAEQAELVDDIRLPAEMRRLVATYRVARGRAERERKHAERAARSLAGHLSRRDAAELLSLSHQRVQQLAERP